MLISLCQLILEGMLMTTQDGEYKLASFVDEQRMSRLYENSSLSTTPKSVHRSRQPPLRFPGPWTMASAPTCP